MYMFRSKVDAQFQIRAVSFSKKMLALRLKKKRVLNCWLMSSDKGEGAAIKAVVKKKRNTSLGTAAFTTTMNHRTKKTTLPHTDVA
jgi:3,4-dihydroxy-2-butanone 4-phosphate synthase